METITQTQPFEKGKTIQRQRRPSESVGEKKITTKSNQTPNGCTFFSTVLLLFLDILEIHSFHRQFIGFEQSNQLEKSSI